MTQLSNGLGSQRPRSRRLIALAIAPLLGLAVLAPAGQARRAAVEASPESTAAQAESFASQLDKATRAAENMAQRAQRAALRANQRASRKQTRKAERNARREAHRKSREAIRLGLKEKDGNVVTIDCEKVMVAYHNFPAVAGRPNSVVEWIEVKNPPESISKEPITFAPIVFSFEGGAATSLVTIPFPVGHYLIDVHAKWDTNGHKGNFDIHGNVTCSPRPAYTINKVQSIAGSGNPPTTETLTGKVGQVIAYQVTVTNTGNTPLTFTHFVDPRCDPGTIAGGSLDPIEPLGTLTYTCTHTLTAADQTAGSYQNVARVSATPEQNEGGAITRESNAVVVTPIAPEKPEEKPEEKPKEKPEEKPEEQPEQKPGQKHEETKPTAELPGTTPGSTATLTAPTATTAKGGVLGFTSATVPSLRGPQGCVRGAFAASIRANGVGTVIFYLDGHRIARLTYRNAHRGLLSVRINPAKLRVGAHRLLAQITMKQRSPSGKATRAVRRLMVVRCGSAVLTPKFTG